MERAYTHRSLIQKLGIKSGQKVLLIHVPYNYHLPLGELPDDLLLEEEAKGIYDFIHVFTTSQADLKEQYIVLKKHLSTTSMLWVSWPKGHCTIATDLNENIVREVGLTNGLVDVKVCSIDEDWSGLKFVYRLKDRK